MAHDNEKLAGDFILLPTYASASHETPSMKDSDESPIMYFAVSRACLKDYLRVDTDEEINKWLHQFTFDENEFLYEYALNEDGIAFAWCEDWDDPLELLGSGNNTLLAVMDFISGTLQENGFEEASKYLDCLLNL